MTRWLLTVEAQDRPGIVASVTQSLATAGCNLADVSMTRLSGVFVMLAVVSVPPAFQQTQLSLPGNTTWREITPAELSPQEIEGERWAITVYGSDKPGIVAAITGELSSRGVNIDDLSTRLVGVGDAATYTMLIEATVPHNGNGETLAAKLSALAKHLGVTAHAAAVDLDTL